MNTRSKNLSWKHAARVVSVSLLAMTTACLDEVQPELANVFRNEGDQAVEPPEPSGNDQGPDEGSEANAGVEGPLTITPSGVAQMLADGGVQLKLQEQAQVSYGCPSVVDLAEQKLELVLHEPIISSSIDDGELTGSTENYDFRVSPARDRLYVLHRNKVFADVPSSALVPESVILQQAAIDLEALGIELGPGQSLSVDRLMRGRLVGQKQISQMVAYKVFVNLEFNGHLVDGPKVVLSYFRDGELHKISARWPAIDGIAGPPLPPPPNVVEEEVFAALAGHPLGAEVNPLTADTELTVVDGQLRHEVQVRGLLDDGEGGGRWGELSVMLPPG